MHTNSRTFFLIDELHRAFDGDPWHGPSVTQVIAGLTAKQAQARPGGEAHSIAELVAHMTAWVNEVTRRISGHPAGEPVEGDWPLPRATDEHGWAAMNMELANAMAHLTETVAGFPESRWDDMVGDTRVASLGTGVSYAQTVSGVVQHLAYHGGQIAILRKLAGW